ncbi:aryl-sulfate sulfotransferase [candidate division KSB1 bacterium]|nr:aryl-sulfate sulfotransferase [candidate division KSB1 bacterium]
MIKLTIKILVVLLAASNIVRPQSDKIFQYIHPLPDSRYVSRYTTIIVKFSKSYQSHITDISNIFQVTGSESGSHSGKSFFSDDRQTVIFKPHLPFHRSERITVCISPVTKMAIGSLDSLKFHFNITDNDDIFLSPLYCPTDKTSEEHLQFTEFDSVRMINGVSVPHDFPGFKSKILGPTAPGDLFLTNWGGTPYLMILKNDGTPQFYKRLPYRAMDFKVHPNGILTRWAFEGVDGYIAMDSTFAVVDTFKCQHGYATDEHGIEILENGHYMLIAKDIQQMDLSKILAGGRNDATVIGNHIQILDTKNQVIFEWRCWDHFDIRDAVHEDLTAKTVHPFHINAAAIDLDGNILISSRHLSEITKIDRKTGKIIWRLGGINNQFEFLNDEDMFSYQHDIRPIPQTTDRYTLFDNGNYHTPPYSRALEIKIDSKFMAAFKVWEYKPLKPLHAVWMGNVQRLPNGNTLINWAEAKFPKVTEVDPNGELLFEGDFQTQALCYRTFRFPWNGKAAAPYLIAETYQDKIVLLFNKFGDHVVKYNIYYGFSPRPVKLLASTGKPWYVQSGLENQRTYYLRVTATDSMGNESSFSNEEKVLVQYADSGGNQIVNGDFSKGMEGWITQFSGNAQGNVAIDESGQYHVSVENGGSSLSQVQFIQKNIKLRQGFYYLFEFDAKTEDSKTIEVKIENQGEPHINYSEIGNIALKSRMEKFQFRFKMNSTTDYNAQLVFNCGKSNSDVWIDNISLKQDMDTPVVIHQSQPSGFFVHQNYPNPFNNSTNIQFYLANKSDVTLLIFNLKGQAINKKTYRRLDPGTHDVLFRADNIPSGCYFYRLTAQGANGCIDQTNVGKMLYLK